MTTTIVCRPPRLRVGGLHPCQPPRGPSCSPRPCGHRRGARCQPHPPPAAVTQRWRRVVRAAATARPERPSGPRAAGVGWPAQYPGGISSAGAQTHRSPSHTATLAGGGGPKVGHNRATAARPRGGAGLCVALQVSGDWRWGGCPAPESRLTCSATPPHHPAPGRICCRPQAAANEDLRSSAPLRSQFSLRRNDFINSD